MPSFSELAQSLADQAAGLARAAEALQPVADPLALQQALGAFGFLLELYLTDLAFARDQAFDAAVAIHKQRLAGTVEATTGEMPLPVPGKIKY